MDVEKRKKLEEKLAAGRKRYANKLPEKWQEIEQTWKMLLAQADNQKVLSAFHRLVHSLAGTGASFGFAEVGNIARQAEILLKTVMTGEQTLADSQELIQNYLDQLQTQMQGV